MAKVTTVTIDDQMEEFIEAQVGHGRYETASDVVAAGLRLLQEQAEIEAIRGAIAEGEQSGEPAPFDFDDFVEKKRAARASR